MGLLQNLGLSPPRGGSGGPAAGDAGAWSSARQTAVAQLRALGNAIRGTGDPAGAALLVLLQAMTKNLAPALRDRRHADEIERYLRDDELLADAEAPNPFGILVDVRAPLLAALSLARPALAE